MRSPSSFSKERGAPHVDCLPTQILLQSDANCLESPAAFAIMRNYRSVRHSQASLARLYEWPENTFIGPSEVNSSSLKVVSLLSTRQRVAFVVLLLGFFSATAAYADTYDAHVTVEALCTPGYAKRHRKVPRNMRDRIYHKFGLQRGQRRGWVIDHRIPLELGGTNDIANLYPQPKAEAHQKDLEENELHMQVCFKQITLAASRAKILQDWSR